MASPAGSKRKRTSAAPATPDDRASNGLEQQTDESEQAPATSPTPSSRRSTRRQQQKEPEQSEEAQPARPSKRQRPNRIVEGILPTDHAMDDEEDDDDDDDDDDEEEEDDTELPPPPIGKLIDPVGGYKTNPPPVGRPVRVYADGVFDLFHLGHMRQLEQAKKAFPDVYLMVGVTGDEETHKRKGLTVLSGKERAETVRHCKWVDEVVENCPWIVTPAFLDEHQIDYVAHDDIPYGADEGDDIYQPIKAAGKFLVTQRTEGVSTTGIITKIVRDYEKYIARQLKRGTSRQELNVSWLKKNELELKRHVQDLRDNIRANWTTTGQELSRELRQFWPASRPQSPAPARPSLQINSPSMSSLNPPDFGTGSVSGSTSPRMAAAARLNAANNAAGNPGTPKSPVANDFVAGYALGLIGGVRSWMTKSRRQSRDGRSRQASDDESEENENNAGEGSSRSVVENGNGASEDNDDENNTLRPSTSRVSSSSDHRRAVKAA